MTDALHEGYILQLANLPGKPGDGKKGPRRVASPEGAAYYGQPIGTIITADLIEAKRAENKAKGIKPTKGMLSGGNKANGTPSAANPEGGGSSAAAGGAAGPGTPGGSGGTGQHPFPTAGNSYAAQGYPAPGIDSTPPDWINDKPETPKMALGIKDSSLNGPKKFNVGGASFNAPEGSRIVRPKGDQPIAFIVTPDKDIHAFTENGEVEIDPTTKKALAARFGSKVNTADTLYLEDEFDDEATLEKVTPGQKLYDADGNDIFTKTETAWKHSQLDIELSEEDIKPLFDSGELSTKKKPVAEEDIDSFEWGDDDDSEIAFSDMSKEDFDSFIDSLEEGEELYVVGGQKVIGADGKEASADEYTTWTKNASGKFVNEDGKIADGTSLGYVKSKLRTIEPTDLKPTGTLAKEQKEGAAAKLKEQADKDELAAQQAEAATFVISGGLHPEQDKKNQEVKQTKAKMAREKAAASKKALEDADGTTEKNEQAAVAQAEADKVKKQQQTAAKKTAEKAQLEKEAVQAEAEHKMNPEIGEEPSEEWILDAPIGSTMVSHIVGSSDTEFSMVPVPGDPYGAKHWVMSRYPHLTPNPPSTFVETKDILKVTKNGDGGIKPYDGMKLNTHDDQEKLTDWAMPGTQVGVFSSDKSLPKMVTITLQGDGLWKSNNPNIHPDSYFPPYGEKFNPTTKKSNSYYVTSLQLPEGEKKKLGTGDKPTIEWMETAPVGAGITAYDTGTIYVKKENGLWGLPGGEGVNNPHQIDDVIGLDNMGIGDPDENWEDHAHPNMTDPASGEENVSLKAGDVVTPEKYLAAPDGTPFKYTKIDGTQTDYVKVDDTTVLMPGGVYQPIHHWQKSIDNGKVTFAQDTPLNKALDGTTKFEKPENWEAPSGLPEPLEAPTGNAAADKLAYDNYVKDLEAAEADLADLDADDDDALGDDGWIDSLNDGTGNGEAVELSWLDGAIPGQTLAVKWEEGSPWVGYTMQDNGNWTTADGAWLGGQEIFEEAFDAVKPVGEPAGLKPSWQRITDADEFFGLPAGSVIRVKEFDDPFSPEYEYTLEWSGQWADDEGGWHDADELWSDNSFVALKTDEPAAAPEPEKTVNEAVEDIQEKKYAFTLNDGTGLKTFLASHLEIQEAITALETHPHGSPVYGLKSLDELNPVKAWQKNFIDGAKLAYPKETPKAALLQVLKSKITVSSDENDLNAANDPVIHLGKDKPAKNAFGVTGGDFKQSEIEEAIAIIDGYGGKLYKSKLTQAGNPLGKLDFNTLVGANKNKIEQKWQVVDHLKHVVNKLEPVKKNTPEDLTPSKPTGGKEFLTGSDLLDAAPAGALVAFDFPEEPQVFMKDTAGVWDSLGKMGKNWEGETLWDEGATKGGLYWLESSPAGMTPVSALDVVEYPDGTKLVYTTNDGSSHLLQRKYGNAWESEDGGLWTNQMIEQGAMQGRVWLHSLPENKKSDQKVKSVQELTDAKIGSVVLYHQSGTEHKVTYTKVHENGWQGDAPGSAAIGPIPDNNFDLVIQDGELTFVSTPDELPGNFTAPPAQQSKFDADGNGPKAQHYHNFAPGHYKGVNSGGAISVDVFADGSAAYHDPSGTKHLTAEEIAPFTFGTADWEYQGIPEANVPKKSAPATKLPKPSIKIDPKKLPNGVFFLGNPYNEGTASWEIKDGVVTAYPVGGDPEPVSPTKLKNAILKGQLVDEFGNTAVIPEGHLGQVMFFNSQTSAQNLMQLREALDNPDFIVGVDSASLATLSHMGVHIPADDLHTYIDATQGGGWNYNTTKQGLKEAIDGMLGKNEDPWQKLLTVDAEAMGQFEWIGDKAYFPSYAAEHFTGDLYQNWSATQAKNVIMDIGSKFGDGNTIGRHVTGMNVQQRRAWLKAFRDGDFKTMYEMEVAGAIKQNKSHEAGWKHPGYSANTVTNQINWGPSVPGESTVDDEIPGSWTPASSALNASASEVDNYLIAANMANPTFLSMDEKRQWFAAHRNKNVVKVNNLSARALSRKESGAAHLTPPPAWSDNVVPANKYNAAFATTQYPVEEWHSTQDAYSAAGEYFDAVMSGEIKVQDVHGKDVPSLKLSALYVQAKEDDPYVIDSAKKLAALKNFFAELRNEHDIETNKPVFKLAPSQTVKGSKHPIFNVVDQFGNKYIFKPAAADVNGEKYRAEVEHAGNAISRFFGGNAPRSWVETFNGKLGVMQEEIDHVGSLNGFNWNTASTTQIVDLANEHLIDWMLDQDDNWAPNTLVTTDGHLAGVDKGRTFRDYGSWNGMVPDASMDVNTHLVYSDLYQAIIQNKISKEDADAAWLNVRKRALKMSKANDGALLEMLHSATDDRSDWHVSYTIDGKKVPQTQQGFFDAFFDRKAKIPEQVEALWKDIYAKAGYGDLPEPPPTVLGEGQHSGLDDANFHEAVLSVGSAGSSTLVSGADVKNGHVNAWQVKSPDGDATFAQIQLGKDKQEEVYAWFKSNSDPTGLSPQKADVTSFTFDHVHAPYLAAAKTIGSHAADGSYNESTLSTFSAKKEAILKDIVHWSPDLEPDAEGYITFPSGTKVSYGHVDQYKMMLDYYQPLGDMLTSAHEAKTTPPQQLEKFVPVNLPAKPSILVKADGSQKLVKLANGSGIFTSGSTVAVVPNGDVDNLIAQGGWSEWAVDETAPTPTYKAKLNPHTFDKSGKVQDFQLTHTGNGIDGSYGQEYEIELPTGEKVFFRNATHTSTVKWQQGSITIKVPNAKTATDLQNGLTRGQQWISDNLGVNLDAATIEDAELTYWRQMFPILSDRKHAPGSKWQKAAADLDTKMAEIGGDKYTFLERFDKKASVDEQNSYFRDLWGKHFGQEKIGAFVAEEKFLPRYEQPNYMHLDKLQGTPIWQRVDYDLADLEKTDHMLAGYVTNEDAAYGVVDTGALYSAEQRIKVLGNMMGSSDQHTGGSNSVFTRVYDSKKTSGIHYIMHPRAMLRTNTRSFHAGDAFGNVELNASHVWSDPGKAWLENLVSNVGLTGKETDLEGLAALFGDLEIIVFENNKAQRLNDAIQLLKSRGIKEIRGVPIEDRLVLRSNLTAAITKLKKTWYK